MFVFIVDCLKNKFIIIVANNVNVYPLRYEWKKKFRIMKINSECDDDDHQQ